MVVKRQMHLETTAARLTACVNRAARIKLRGDVMPGSRRYWGGGAGTSSTVRPENCTSPKIGIDTTVALPVA